MTNFEKFATNSLVDTSKYGGRLKCELLHLTIDQYVGYNKQGEYFLIGYWHL
jgi:hypothetical protein